MHIVKIDDLYYLTYTAYDGVNALGIGHLARFNTFRTAGSYCSEFLVMPTFTVLRSAMRILTKGTSVFMCNLILMKGLKKKILLSDKNVMFFHVRLMVNSFLHRIRPIQIASVAQIKVKSTYWSDYLMHFDQHILMAPKITSMKSDCLIGGRLSSYETKRRLVAASTMECTIPCRPYILPVRPYSI